MRTYVGVFLLFVATLQAQTPALVFEVASIKPTDGTSRSSALMDPQPSGFSASNVPLARLIEFAYGLNPEQIIGGPDWIAKERFTVTAKYPAGWSLDRPGGRTDALQMVRMLLADRFRLRVHTETRDGAIYSMVMTRQDRGLGPNLRQVPASCIAASSNEAKEKGLQQCGLLQGRSELELNGQPLSYLASRLSAIIGTHVVDQTGADGFYDAHLKWTPEQSIVTAPTADQVSIFTAIQEQLGLRLERGRGPVDVLVIDSVERLTPD